MRTPSIRALFAALCPISLAAPVLAQGPAFDSPGLSSVYNASQADRFSTEFNPALGLVIDAFVDYSDGKQPSSDGYDADIRLVEVNASAYVDPDAWAYVAIVAEGGEIELEEAAVEYIGFEGNTTVKAGQFFVDFGKQMQQHLEELRTLERPLVLREFLGEELSGVGAQVDHWFALNDTTPVRFSVGVFASLLGEDEVDEDAPPMPTSVVPERKNIDELSISARLTGMTDAGESGVLQFGLSGRHVPEFMFEFGGVQALELSNTVYGADLTYGWNDDTGTKDLLIGGEALVLDGDLSAQIDDPLNPAVLTVTDDDVFGYFAYAQYGWDQRNSGGVQYSRIESPEDPRLDLGELDFYLTHHFTELRRLRLGFTHANSDNSVDDTNRVYLQFTNFFGNHAHGLNW